MASLTREDLLLLPLSEALAKVGQAPVAVSVVTPPYPALGKGSLRVVRVREEGPGLHLDLSYEDYERLP